MKSKAKKKKHCPNHKKNMAVGILALFSLLLLSLYSALQNDPTITGAAILKNSCDASPDVFVIFGSNDNAVYAVDGARGCAVWKYDTEADVKATPAVSGESVFIGNAVDEFFAISLADGSEIWTAETGKIYGAAATDGTNVYVGDNAGTVSAYPIGSGTALWSYTAKNVKPDLIVDEGILYIVDEYLKVGSVIAIDTATQTAKWKFSAKSEISAAPLVTTDALYVPSNENTLYKLNKKAGVVVWKFATAKSIRSTPIIDDDGILYFGSNDGFFYAVNSKDGKLVWKYEVKNAITATAVADDTNVYFGAQNNYVYAVTKDQGKLVWSLKTGGKIYGALAMYDDMLYAASADYSLYAINSANGQALWTYKTKGALYGGVVVVEG